MSGSAEGQGAALPRRFRDHVCQVGLLQPGDGVLVALSGGLDSVVLLHLLRFHPPVEGLTLSAAHLNHRMRPGSDADALWVAGLAAAWDVPLARGVADPPPGTEDQARDARYAFLRRAAAESGAQRIATAHHADDQAETVLFRIARGTGIGGLRGVPARGGGGLVRPLLPFWREELEAYAAVANLRWRTDPTNADCGYARNAIRHEVLPLLEARVSSGARKALARLARLAGREEEAWRSVLPDLVTRVVESSAGGRFVVARGALLAYHSAVAARVVRLLAHRLGVVLDEAGTRVALDFAASAPSGREAHLPDGLRLRRDFDHLILERAPASGRAPTSTEGNGLVIHDEGPGVGRVEIGHRCFEVTWGPGVSPERGGTETFPVRVPAFPLLLRPWRPGDRIRMTYGSKKLKKLFREARIPAADRRRTPVLSDGRGDVLWVPGLARAAGDSAKAPDMTITLEAVEADEGGGDGRTG